jgi:hypothetical protein
MKNYISVTSPSQVIRKKELSKSMIENMHKDKETDSTGMSDIDLEDIQISKNEMTFDKLEDII